MRFGNQKTGYLLKTDPETGDVERDCLTCNHCQKQVVVEPIKGADTTPKQIHRCGQCSRTICDRCAADLARTLKCAPWEKRLERIEARDRFLKAAAS